MEEDILNFSPTVMFRWDTLHLLQRMNTEKSVWYIYDIQGNIFKGNTFKD